MVFEANKYAGYIHAPILYSLSDSSVSIDAILPNRNVKGVSSSGADHEWRKVGIVPIRSMVIVAVIAIYGA